MLERIRLALRITTEEFDSQIEAYTKFVKNDLIAHNMSADNWNVEDPLINMCCELYAKAMFDYEGKGDWYQKRYRALRDNMVTMMRYINA